MTHLFIAIPQHNGQVIADAATATSSGRGGNPDLPTPGGSLSTVLSISITSKSSVFDDFLLCTLLRLDRVRFTTELDFP
ncbi:hypothetical protein TYRP_012612 [Tyrophagus putrescentiae]|nr:hypothetical protein TYRP_012612 [Tyrophagus putrescentiae]